MIDTWFIHDIKKILDEKQKLVFVDPSGEAEFLLNVVPPEIKVLKANTELEELELRYKISKENIVQKLIIYTNTPKENLTFIREYCETDGCLEIRQIDTYIKAVVHTNLGLNLHLTKEELLTAAKISIARDRSYWMELVHKGASEIFDLNQMLLPFLKDPKEFMSEMDIEVSKMFSEKVAKFIQADYIQQPAQTLANQVAQSIFQGLLMNNLSSGLKEIYTRWEDSSENTVSFKTYIANFKLEVKALWKVSVDHPFVSVDEQMLDEVIAHSGDKAWISEKLPWITARSKNKVAKRQNICFWSEIIQLLTFDSSAINALDNLESVAAHYANTFYKTDRAIRKLYTSFLNQPKKLRPLQEIYEEHNRILLNQWFKHFSKYKSNQAGLLLRLINKATEKTAFIVGDAITYEIAVSVSEKLSKDFNTSKEMLFTGFPSVTEHNMSLIYQNNGVIEPTHKKREEFLQSQISQPIQFVSLEELNESAANSTILVCSYKDMDSLGEKLQQKALKFIDGIEDTLTQKIRQIQQLGYKSVYLVSDHGFVLTGLLSESDKIEVNFTGNIQKGERFILSESSQGKTENLIELEQAYNNYKYLYFAPSNRPFKTPGLYGFSHGGITPQELICPLFCFKSKNSTIEKLSISITNKEELANQTTSSFIVNMEAQKASSLLDSARKCQLLLFADNKQIAKSDILTIQNEQKIQKEYEFDQHFRIDIILIDAETKEQIDKTTVVKKQIRNLGGLL
jgi:hypothetical protein